MQRRFTLWFGLVALLTLVGLPAAYAQGFKNVMGKGPETMLKRKLAAYVVIKNKRIRLLATAQGNVPKDLTEILMTKLRTDVQKDTGFIEDEKNPETILRFTATAFDNEHRQFQRRSGNDVVQVTQVTANVEVSYQAIETKTNAPVDSENLTAIFKQEYPPSGESGSFLGSLNPLNKLGNRDSSLPPTKSEVQSYLLQNIVKLMAQRATPVEETFPVLLPRGKYDQISLTAQQQAWGKVLEAAETMPAMPKQDEDAYRHYLIGLANEALAYQESSNDKVLAFLFKARKSYEDAKFKNPKEKEFIRPWTRVDEAVKQYDKITRQLKEYNDYLANNKGASRATPPQPAAGVMNAPTQPAPSSGTGGPKIWNNQMVIELWKSGNVTEQQLADFVRNAPTHKFDPNSPDAALELITAKVPAGVIQAMREKTNPTAARPAAPKPAPAPARKPRKP